MARCSILCFLLAAVAAIPTATAVDVPSFPADFHAVVYASGQGHYCQCPSFNEVYQDVTNNRALIVTNEVWSLLVVDPKGAASGTKEETEMTLFVVNNWDGSCTYEVNDWPCIMPYLNVSQCSVSYFGYPVFKQVGPWQLPNKAPKNYAGKDVIELDGRVGVPADKWTEQTEDQKLNTIDTFTYWVDPSNPSIPLRYQQVHKAIGKPEYDWYYQLDYIKVELSPSPDSVFTPPENWLERCVDNNAGLKIIGIPWQALYLFAQPNKPAKLSFSLYTRPVSNLPVIVNITFCSPLSSCAEYLTCSTNKICTTCVKVFPTKLEFTQENWNQPQEVTMAFGHVGGVGKYQVGVSDNYPIQNPGQHFIVYSCDPDNNTPCDCNL